MFLMFIPILFINNIYIHFFWAIFASSIYMIFNNIDKGEQAAIWCYLSIFFFLPISILSDELENLFSNLITK